MSGLESRHESARLTALSLVVAGVLAGAPSATRAQEETERETAELIGQVVSASTGLPLEGARVILLGSGYGAITDAEGNFSVPRTWAGRDSVEVRYIGYEAGYTVIDLEPGQTTRVTLTLSSTVIRIADLTVEIRQSRRAQNQEGFLERMAKGFGTFFTPRDIINRNPRLPSDLLRGLANVTVGRLEYGRADVYLGEGARLGCPPAVYLDGMYQPGLQFDDLEKELLGAVEIYRRDVETPMEFLRTGSTCGAIVVWSPDGAGLLDWASEPPNPFE